MCAHVLNRCPVSELSEKYDSPILREIRKKNFPAKPLLEKLYLHANFDKKNDHVISFESIWETMGFNIKSTALKFIRDNLVEGDDYREVKLSRDELRGVVDRKLANKRKKLTLTCRGYAKIRMLVRNNRKEVEKTLDLEDVMLESILNECDELKKDLIVPKDIVSETEILRYSGKDLVYFLEVDPGTVIFGVSRGLPVHFFQECYEYFPGFKLLRIFETAYSLPLHRAVSELTEKNRSSKMFKGEKLDNAVDVSRENGAGNLLAEVEVLLKDIEKRKSVENMEISNLVRKLEILERDNKKMKKELRRRDMLHSSLTSIEVNMEKSSEETECYTFLIEFLGKLYDDNKNAAIFYRSKDIHKIYTDYASEKEKKFFKLKRFHRELSKFRSYSRRKVIAKQGDKEYVEGKYRTKFGVNIRFNLEFAEDLAKLRENFVRM